MTSVDDKMNKWNKLNTSMVKDNNFVSKGETKKDSVIETLLPMAVLYHQAHKSRNEYISEDSDITVEEYVNYLDNLSYDDTKMFNYNNCEKYINDETDNPLLEASVWCQYWKDVKYKEEQVLLEQEQETETSEYGSDEGYDDYSKFDYV